MPLRSFQHHGAEWTVWDTHPLTAGAVATGRLAVADGFADGWLTFECADEKRRLAPVPVEWFHLTDGQLAALLEGAAPVRKLPPMSL